MIIVALAIAVFVASASVDNAHARYAFARDAGHAYIAASWSVVQWMAASVGFMVAVYVSPWFLPCEALGLAAGTIAAMRRR